MTEKKRSSAQNKETAAGKNIEFLSEAEERREKAAPASANQSGRRTQRKKIGRLGRILLGLLLFASAAFAINSVVASVLYFGMRPIAAAEYGEPLPEASIFAPKNGAAYSDVPEEAEKLGLHRLSVIANGGERVVWLWVRDTKAPRAYGQDVTISSLSVLRPDELIEQLTDADRVKVSFLETPPFGTVGDYAPEILLEDTSGNQRVVTASLHIRVTNEGGVTVEAGDAAPDATAFLCDAYSVTEMTEITEKMLHTPGEYPIFLTVDGAVYESLLTVVDTVAPKATAHMVTALPGDPVLPEDFLSAVEDATEVTASFVAAPDPDSRELQPIAIRLTDLGGNTTEVQGSLLYTHAKPLTIEARTTPLTVEECVPEGTGNAVLERTVIPNRIGTFAVTLLVNGTRELGLLEIRDTTPPVLRVEDVDWFVNHPLEAESLCEEISDVTETTVSFESPVDWSREGTQTVTLLAEDAGGNITRATLTLTLVRDTEPPELYGVVNRNCYVGEAVAYFAEVFAEDEIDGRVTVEVDNSAVDINRAGTYQVTYTATDADGNSTSASCRFTFVKATVTDEEVEAAAREVLAEILTDDMTKVEKLEAAFNYVRRHVHYVGTSDKTDWRKEAVRGIRTGRGDCFTFYASLRALLDQIDVEYMSVTRKGGTSRHYWLIVNVGTGWYHLDATYTSIHQYRCFMWTNQQCKVKSYFWRFEESNYPEIATEPFNKTAAIAMERAGTLP